MTDPISFDSTTPRFALPRLFAGQAQKEIFVNEAHARIDAIVHCAVEATQAAPPATPVEGQSWLVGGSPTGDWAGQAGKIASRQGGQWLFTPARDGMKVLDRATGQERRYHGGWKGPAAPSAPSGGATVDAEARAAIAELVAKLREAWVFPDA